jgi:uncharacterized membrane protein
MNKTIALAIVTVISAAGMAFSGYLSYSELTSGSCLLGGCSKMFGLPACVFGCLMFLLIFAVCILGFRDRQLK